MGAVDWGGNSAAVADDLSSGVVEVFANDFSFAALKEDGSVISWGFGGGESSALFKYGIEVNVAGDTSGAGFVIRNYGTGTTLTASNYSDEVYGGSDSDVLIALSGDDYVDAGGGDDLIVGGDGAGNDRYIGGTGTDTVKYTSALAGITVNLSASTNQAKSTLSGDPAGIGVDQLSGIENIIAGSYSDTLTGNAEKNRIEAGFGNDLLYGLDGNDTLKAGSGNDKSYGEAGNDSLYMDAGNDTVDGGSGTDWLYVTGSTNSVVDLAKAIGQNTGYGTDILKNIENASGGSGVDKFHGTTGNNTLRGNNGNDLLYGQGGNDSLQGDAGKDSLTGGSGADSFIFRAVSESATGGTTADVITDFVRGTDQINLSAIDAFAGTSANDTFIWKGTAGFNSTTKGEVRYEQFNNAGTADDYTMVWIDNDRDAGVEMAIRLTGMHNLTQSDFVM